MSERNDYRKTWGSHPPTNYRPDDPVYTSVEVAELDRLRTELAARTAECAAWEGQSNTEFLASMREALEGRGLCVNLISANASMEKAHNRVAVLERCNAEMQEDAQRMIQERRAQQDRVAELERELEDARRANAHGKFQATVAGEHTVYCETTAGLKALNDLDTAAALWCEQMAELQARAEKLEALLWKWEHHARPPAYIREDVEDALKEWREADALNDGKEAPPCGPEDNNRVEELERERDHYKRRCAMYSGDLKEMEGSYERAKARAGKLEALAEHCREFRQSLYDDGYSVLLIKLDALNDGKEVVPDAAGIVGPEEPRSDIASPDSHGEGKRGAEYDPDHILLNGTYYASHTLKDLADEINAAIAAAYERGQEEGYARGYDTGQKAGDEHGFNRGCEEGGPKALREAADAMKAQPDYAHGSSSWAMWLRTRASALEGGEAG